jgi:hypothetical protein
VETLKDLVARRDALNAEIDRRREKERAGVAREIRKRIAELNITWRDLYPHRQRAPRSDAGRRRPA